MNANKITSGIDGDENLSSEEIKGNILIVDDVPDNLRFLSETLEKRGYAVRSAINGSMALIGAQTTLPDLMLLDIMMPEMDGYQVCQQLKADMQTCDIPVIFLSALDEVIDKVKAFEVGGVDYITKPFQVEEVLARVENQLTIRKLQRQLQHKNLELEKFNRELEQSNQELEQFAHIVSHDLQQPLQSIITSVDLLLMAHEQERDDDDIKQYGDFIKTSSFRMSQLIQGILTYAKVGAGEQGFDLTDCNLVLEQAIANLKAAIAEKDARITYDALPTITANHTLLVQLFQNLISNAIKFQRQGECPRIEILAQQQSHKSSLFSNVEASAQDGSSPMTKNSGNGQDTVNNNGKWLFAVRDNGIGMEPQQSERIFQIFQRLRSADQYPGSGIGLSTCKKIVERHNGEIWVESELGVGTTFYFTLPTC